MSTSTALNRSRKLSALLSAFWVAAGSLSIATSPTIQPHVNNLTEATLEELLLPFDKHRLWTCLCFSLALALATNAAANSRSIATGQKKETSPSKTLIDPPLFATALFSVITAASILVEEIERYQLAAPTHQLHEKEIRSSASKQHQDLHGVCKTFRKKAEQFNKVILEQPSPYNLPPIPIPDECANTEPSQP